MDSISISDIERQLPAENFDLSGYSKKVFQMFSGEETEVTIEFANELIGVVYDRFGVDIPIVKKGDKHFACTVRVAVSPVFLSWIMSFGTRARIAAPQSVADELCTLAKTITEMYDK